LTKLLKLFKLVLEDQDISVVVCLILAAIRPQQ
jgi:hypothetical protein